MDALQKFYAENKDILVSVLHLVIVIPLIFLALRPEYLPAFLSKTAVLYAVYVLLAVGVLNHGIALGEAIKARMPQKVEASEEPVEQAEIEMAAPVME